METPDHEGGIEVKALPLEMDVDGRHFLMMIDVFLPFCLKKKYIHKKKAQKSPNFFLKNGRKQMQFVSEPNASRGGLELLLENSTKVHKVEVTTPKDGQGKVTMKLLLSWVKDNLIKERPEMFVKGDSVRPGVLVLINDCDWELCGGLDAELEEKDVVVFISTLHGG
ncbi:unnamed protein product [Miscanthus lutarioriparius]|uniref:Ubiquitin-related modifier 1 homolog n=1 Tax=Miscanthus lutarioriparius TaxID=422564 RepID=A0A811NGY7_9POAL|nr:unnamed protein product [Miscanthus lutarioriparius]